MSPWLHFMAFTKTDWNKHFGEMFFFFPQWFSSVLTQTGFRAIAGVAVNVAALGECIYHRWPKVTADFLSLASLLSLQCQTWCVIVEKMSGESNRETSAVTSLIFKQQLAVGWITCSKIRRQQSNRRKKQHK